MSFKLATVAALELVEHGVDFFIKVDFFLDFGLQDTHELIRDDLFIDFKIDELRVFPLLDHELSQSLHLRQGQFHLAIRLFPFKFGVMIRPRLKIILWLFTIISTLLIMSVAGAFFSLDKEMAEKLEQKKFLQPTEFLAQGPRLALRQKLDEAAFLLGLEQQSYRSRQINQALLPGDYIAAEAADCLPRWAAEDAPSEALRCLIFIPRETPADLTLQETLWLWLGQDGEILKISKGSSRQDLAELRLAPLRLAQYLGDEPLMQEEVPLAEIPPACLNAVIAIEDQSFLEHKGFSVTGFARAALRNLFEGRAGQGGSTITQQLVKNYFLTSEKTIRRKLKELGMSILLESKYTKDQILETYLNIIYMGQNGAFRVHGYGSASRMYFGKALQDLDLAECALLAAIVNNPGGLHPWRKPEAALKRRQLVLGKMEELKLASPSALEAARQAPLPSKRSDVNVSETAPYFVDAVRKQLKALNLPTQGVRVLTGLDLGAQQAAQAALQKHLDRLEKEDKRIRELKEKGQRLEGAMLAADPQTGLVQVVVGGRNFRMTQFNRAVESRRQVGSIMKPIVVLAALEYGRQSGEPLTPLTLLKDEKFEVRYEGQKWSPENYGKKYFGEVPLFFALKESLNAATASLGLDVGLERVVSMARQLGVESDLKPLPALTLGAYEMRLPEVLTISMTLANLGEQPVLSYIQEVRDLGDQVLYTHQPQMMQATDPVATAVLVGMMKQGLISGTARAARSLGFDRPAAGKTGTTNDSRDTWFMGFTPDMAAVVWVGYDETTPSRLTGGSGAVPIWTEFMKQVTATRPADDFKWPEGTELKQFDHGDLKDLGLDVSKEPETTELIFREED